MWNLEALPFPGLTRPIRGDLVEGSEASIKARRRQADRGTVRISTRSPAKTVGKPVRMTLTLSAEAAKRIKDRAHNTSVKPGIIASELFVAHLPRYSTRAPRPTRRRA